MMDWQYSGLYLVGRPTGLGVGIAFLRFLGFGFLDGGFFVNLVGLINGIKTPSEKSHQEHQIVAI